jgi:hypothetical protein
MSFLRCSYFLFFDDMMFELRALPLLAGYFFILEQFLLSDPEYAAGSFCVFPSPVLESIILFFFFFCAGV